MNCASAADGLPFHHDKSESPSISRRPQSPDLRAFHPASRGVANVEVEFTRRAPAFHFNVVVFVFADRNAIIRCVRDRQCNITNFSQQKFQLSFRLIQFFTQFAIHFQTYGLIYFPVLFHRRNDLIENGTSRAFSFKRNVPAIALCAVQLITSSCSMPVVDRTVNTQSDS